VFVDLVAVVFPVVVVFVVVDEGGGVGFELGEFGDQGPDLGGVLRQRGGDLAQVVGEAVGPVLDRLRGREQPLGLRRLVVGGQALEVGVDIRAGVADVPGIGLEAAVGFFQQFQVAGVLGNLSRLDHLVCVPGFFGSRSGALRALVWA